MDGQRADGRGTAPRHKKGSSPPCWCVTALQIKDHHRHRPSGLPTRPRAGSTAVEQPGRRQGWRCFRPEVVCAPFPPQRETGRCSRLRLISGGREGPTVGEPHSGRGGHRKHTMDGRQRCPGAAACGKCASSRVICVCGSWMMVCVGDVDPWQTLWLGMVSYCLHHRDRGGGGDTASRARMCLCSRAPHTTPCHHHQSPRHTQRTHTESTLCHASGTEPPIPKKKKKKVIVSQRASPA